MVDRRWFHVSLLACGFALFGGCGREESDFTETKRLDERVTRSELASFLRIAEALPDGTFPQSPATFAPLPQWERDRTLPVNELLREERRGMEDRWDVGVRTRRMETTRRFERMLVREGLSAEQFVAIGLALGAAMARSTLEEDRDPNAIRKRAAPRIAGLERDGRTFASLAPEEQYRLLQEAAWLVRADRAERLRDVPPENVELVRGQWEALRDVMPAEFAADPFEAIVDPLEEYGVPFTDADPTRDDARIRWSPEEAVVGTDALPDDGGHSAEEPLPPAITGLGRRSAR